MSCRAASGVLLLIQITYNRHVYKPKRRVSAEFSENIDLSHLWERLCFLITRGFVCQCVVQVQGLLIPEDVKTISDNVTRLLYNYSPISFTLWEHFIKFDQTFTDVLKPPNKYERIAMTKLSGLCLLFLKENNSFKDRTRQLGLCSSTF